MMSAQEIREWARKRVSEFLQSVAKGENFFPREVNFGRLPATTAFETLKEAFAALRAGEASGGYRVSWEERQTARWGRQIFPARVWFEDEEGFVLASGCSLLASALRSNLKLTEEKCRALLPWVREKARRVAEAGDVWPGILEVARYFIANPRPRLYPRQLPLPLPTKFIDQQHELLRPVLDFLLGDQADPDARTFNGRFHLLEDEAPVRMRFVDDALMTRAGFRVHDITQPLSQFNQHDPSADVVLVVENKMCFLTLPAIAGGLAIWGGGKAAALLGKTTWLARCRLIYWGDMDDTGYNILSELRKHHAHVESLLMDEQAWQSHQLLAHEDKLDASPPSSLHLTEPEAVAWRQVRLLRQMIEQEKIPLSVVVTALDLAGIKTPPPCSYLPSES